MIRKSDIQWWVQEARGNPESVQTIIEELAKRLIELDTENEALRGQVIQLQAGAPDASTDEEMSTLQQRVDTLQTILDGQTSTEPALVFISNGGHALRMPLSQVRLRLREKRPALEQASMVKLRCLALARPQDDVLILTNQGRAIRLYLHQIPFLVEKSNWPSTADTQLLTGERVTAAAALAERPRFWSVVTRRGYVQQFLHPHLDKHVEADTPFVKSPIHNDEPVAIVNGDRGDLLLITRWGKAARYPQREIGIGGSVGFEVDRDDEVVGALPLRTDGEVLALTAAGNAMRRDTIQFKGRSKPGGSGRTFMQAFDVLGIIPYAARGKLLFLTYSGRFVSLPTSGIPQQSRAGRGAQLQDLSRDPAAAVVFIPGKLL